MITITGNGRLTRDIELRSTDSGKSVATISVASDRRDRQAPGLFVDLVVWERQAEAAAEHLVKGQAVSFSGRFDPREYSTASGDKRLALEVHDVTIEYGPKPRRRAPHRRRTRRRGQQRRTPRTTTFRSDRRAPTGPSTAGGPVGHVASIARACVQTSFTQFKGGSLRSPPAPAAGGRKRPSSPPRGRRLHAT